MKGKLIQVLALGALTAGTCLGQTPCGKDELLLDGECWLQVVEQWSGWPSEVGSRGVWVKNSTCPSTYVLYVFNHIEFCIPKDAKDAMSQPAPAQVTQAKSEPVKQPATRLGQTTCRPNELLLDGSCWPQVLNGVHGKVAPEVVFKQGRECPSGYVDSMVGYAQTCSPSGTAASTQSQPAPVAQATQAKSEPVTQPVFARNNRELKANKQGKQSKLSRQQQCAQQFPSLSSDTCFDLAEHKFWVGMTFEQLIFSRGSNYTSNVTMTGGHVSAQLVYYDSLDLVLSALSRTLPRPVCYVYVEDDVVTAIQF